MMRAEVFEPEEGTYRLEQCFRYSYDGPVRRLRHRLVVVPRAVHGAQRRLDHGVRASGDPVLVSTITDGFANHVVEVRAAAVETWIEFEAWAVVAFRGHGGVSPVPASTLTDPDWLTPTALTTADADLADAARALASVLPRTGLDLAERICAWTHRSIAYEWGITCVQTTAAKALAGGRGVCQDYAHVMLAVSRAAGLPCRYVSGHLVGEGGSHAWVEVLVPDPSTGGGLAVAFDPTHDRVAGAGYLTVAIGRDYTDVAPTSGTFVGSACGAMSAQKRLQLLPSG